MTTSGGTGHAPHTTEVMVIGGGPVGLSLALHLDMYGVKTTLVEQAPDSRWHPKGNTNSARTMETFRRLSISEPIRKLGLPADHPFDIAFYTRLSTFEIARGHTPSRRDRLATRDQSSPTDQVPEPPHRANQMYVEKFLYERAKTCPNITLRFGMTAETFEQDDSGVSVVLRPAEGGAEENWRAAYIVGCDGSRGLVRRKLAIKYAGEEELMDVFMAGLFTTVYMRIPDLYPRFVGRRPAWMYVAVNPDLRAQIICLNGKDEFMIHLPTRDGDVMNDATITERVKRAIGADIPIEILGYKQWSAGTYLVAEKYAEGRAFLAGDAAHLYAPTGGFGMNTGIDDGSNLSWKLAASLQGWGGPSLLATYELERRPIALRNAGMARELGKSRHDVEVTSVIEEDSPAGEAAREKVQQSDFITKSHFLVPEERDSLGVILGVRYDGSPIIVADGTPPEDILETYSPSSVPGGRAPHLWLGTGRGMGDSLYDHLGIGFTLLCLGTAPQDTKRFEGAAQDLGIPIKILELSHPAARGLYDRRLYLIRPDQVIAWRGDEVPSDVEALLALVTGGERAPRHAESSVSRPEVRA
ncbi:MAG: FAD-dependent monooxygenase [Alphaproteobacteria bacterium]|nr:FAD-dependent monooxygenase [Alphaproteobacteria bacterium]